MEIYPLSSGMFDDSYRPICGNLPSLTQNEFHAAQIIKTRLRAAGSATVVDLGAMLGTSMIVLGTHFRKEVESGKLRLVATNRHQIPITELIEETQRRLDLVGGDEKNWWNRPPKMEENFFSLELPLLPDSDTVNFVRNYHGLVQYIPAVDSGSLHEFLTDVDLVHERLGGLHYAGSLRVALISLAKTLKITGQLMTTTYIYARPSNDELLKYLRILSIPFDYSSSYLFYQKS